MIDMQNLIENEKNRYAKNFYVLLHSENYRLTGKNKYKNSSTKVEVEYPIGHVFLLPPKHFMWSGSRCPNCSKKKRIKNSRRTHEEFLGIVSELVGEEYSVLGTYFNSTTAISMRHNSDDCNSHEWKVAPGNFLAGRRCPICSRVMASKNSRKTHTQFVDEVYKLTNGMYTVIGEYTTSKSKIEMKHNSCGHIWRIIPNSFLYGVRCPNCHGGVALTHETFSKRVEEMVDKEYSVIGKYSSSQTKIKMRHNNDSCNSHIWEVTPSNFLRGSRCPICRESRGERYIRKILKKEKYSFFNQVKIDGCRNIYPLPFDFGVYDDGRLIALIEYQGIHHYEPTDFAGKGKKWAEQQLKKVQNNDNIKRKFCKDNKIPLIEIHYSLTDEEVSDFLLSKLSGLKIQGGR